MMSFGSPLLAQRATPQWESGFEQGFPGEWNYWIDPADGRGGKGDRPVVAELERLQLSVQPEARVSAQPYGYGVEIESVTLDAAGIGGAR